MYALPVQKGHPMLNRLRCMLLLLLSLFVAVNAFARNEAASVAFRDPTPQERAMTSVAVAPGASAVVLSWRQFVNDRDSYRSEYLRIKILSEQGKKYGDVEIPHVALFSDVNHIKARTVRPDGTIAAFDGKTFDKVVVKVGGVRLIAKTFTLPDVQVGSIIEYRYDIATRGYMLYNSEFTVQREIPVLHLEDRNLPLHGELAVVEHVQQRVHRAAGDSGPPPGAWSAAIRARRVPDVLQLSRSSAG